MSTASFKWPAWWQTGLLCGLLLLTALASRQVIQHRVWLAHAASRPLTLSQGIPAHFADWQEVDDSNVIQVSADAQAVLDNLYSQQLVRTYVNAQGQKVMLSIAYGEDQSSDQSQVHRPEICYVSQGFSLLSSQSGSIPSVTGSAQALQLVARLRDRNEPITYWMVIGDQIVNPGWQRKWAQLRYAIQRQVPDGLLFRVSSIEEDNQRAFRLQGQFIQGLLSAVDPVTRTHLVGRGQRG